jgi:hypothetical protein
MQKVERKDISNQQLGIRVYMKLIMIMAISHIKQPNYQCPHIVKFINTLAFSCWKNTQSD